MSGPLMRSTVKGLEWPQFQRFWPVFLLKSGFHLGRPRVAAGSVSAPREAPGPSIWQGLRPFSSCWTGWQSVAPGSGPHHWLERRRVNTCQLPRPSGGTTLSSDPPGASAGLHGIPPQLPTAGSTPDARFSGRLDLANSPRHSLSGAPGIASQGKRSHLDEVSGFAPEGARTKANSFKKPQKGLPSPSPSAPQN